MKQNTLEWKIVKALGLSCSGSVSVFEYDEESGEAQFIVYREGNEDASVEITPDALVREMTSFIASGAAGLNNAYEWLNAKEAVCTAIEDEEEDVFIEEAEALDLWRKQTESERTAHLAPFPSPDGVMSIPMHEAPASSGSSCSSAALPPGFVSPTQSQLKRDPELLEFDNVPRVDLADISKLSWKEPVIITGVGMPTDTTLLTQKELVEHYGDSEVRTGNRATLAENGFVNSKPMELCEALESPHRLHDPECSRIVFSPEKELPEGLRRDLAPLESVFPVTPLGFKIGKKFTLCLGAEGFGIGMHKHNAAMFLLVLGKKKWYMGQANTVTEPTHPHFYREKSSHKCIQKPGEILYVPDQWYHEIFNLEYTAGLQALPDEGD